MRLHRFIYPNLENIGVGEKILVRDENIIHQIKNVFRMSEGDIVILCDNNFRDFIVSIEEMEKREISFLIQEKKELIKDEKEIYVFVSLIKPNKFDDLLPHLIEVGATKIIPILTERTQKRNLKFERLQEIIKEATEQSGRGRVPEIFEAMDFENAIDFAKEKGLEVFVFHTENFAEKNNSPKENSGKDSAVFVGPEGGFTEKEISFAIQNGAQTIFLGENILRAETAGVIATYLVSQKLI